MSNTSQSTNPVGRVLWDELLVEVILPYVLYCIRFKCICRANKNCKSLVLQDKCNIEIFLSPEVNNKGDEHSVQMPKKVNTLAVTPHEPHRPRCVVSLSKTHLSCDM